MVQERPAESVAEPGPAGAFVQAGGELDSTFAGAALVPVCAELVFLGLARLSLCQRVAHSLQHGQDHLPVGAVHLHESTRGRQVAGVGFFDSGDHRRVETVRLPGAGAFPPVSPSRHQRVPVMVVPVLELEVRAVRGRPPRRVDPDP